MHLFVQLFVYICRRGNHTQIVKIAIKDKLINFEKDFMRSIGHELKTPIAIINGYIEALQDDIVSDEEKNNVYSKEK